MVFWKSIYKQLNTRDMIKKILQLVVVLLFTAQGVMAQSVEIHDVVTAPGDISVQVDMMGYTGTNGNVAAITLSIEFDSDLMDFVGIDDTQLNGSWVVSDDANPIIITYTATPTGTGYDINGKAFDLLFYYRGGFSSDLLFDTVSCEIANSDLAGIPSTYVDGSVTQSAAVGTVSMTALVDTIGNTVYMPVDMDGAAFDSVASVTFKVAFDDCRMSFENIVEDAMTGVTANASDGMLTIEWDGNGATMDFTSHHLFDIEFVYIWDTADVVFVAGCEVSDVDLTPLAVDYTDGVVTPVVESSSLTISDVTGTPDTNVDVPIVAAGFVTDVGAITMNISYDDAKLTYTGYTKQQLLTGWVVTSSNPGLVEMEWSSLTGETLADGDLVTLQFNYDTLGGQADVKFVCGTIVKDVNLVTIPNGFVDGSVTDGSGGGSYTVSGMLKYANASGSPLANSIVYLMSGATVLDQDTTDASGNYEFTDVVDGSYTIDASTTIAWGGVNIVDALIIKVNSATFVPGTMTFIAADVNESTTVTIVDALIIKNWVGTGIKVAAWSAPDWIFDIPAITVVASNITQDIEGICSGDANASYIP